MRNSDPKIIGFIGLNWLWALTDPKSKIFLSRLCRYLFIFVLTQDVKLCLIALAKNNNKILGIVSVGLRALSSLAFHTEMLNFSAWLWMPWKAYVFSYRYDSHQCLFAQMDCSPQRYKQADRREKCVLLGRQRTQTTLSDIQRRAKYGPFKSFNDWQDRVQSSQNTLIKSDRWKQNGPWHVPE